MNNEKSKQKPIPSSTIISEQEPVWFAERQAWMKRKMNLVNRIEDAINKKFLIRAQSHSMLEETMTVSAWGTQEGKAAKRPVFLTIDFPEPHTAEDWQQIEEEATAFFKKHI